MTAVAERGSTFEPQGERGFDQCWYPLALSSEVPAGQVVGRQFLSGKVAVFRAANGTVSVVSAYCRHLGADLSIGSVEGNELRCPFHYWYYNSEGRCSKIAAGDTPPAGARLFKFPTAESLGLIWAFNGETPLFPVPSFDTPDAELELRVWRNPSETPVDHSLFFLNAFDLQHFGAVHGMKIEIRPEDTRATQYVKDFVFRTRTPEFGEMAQRRRLWGTGTITVSNQSGGRTLYMAHALCALPGNRCQGYLVNATPKDATNPAATQAVLADAQVYSRRLIEEDAPIMRTIHFRQDLLTASDRLLAEGIHWIRNFPRANPAEPFLQ